MINAEKLVISRYGDPEVEVIECLGEREYLDEDFIGKAHLYRANIGGYPGYIRIASDFSQMSGWAVDEDDDFLTYIRVSEKALLIAVEVFDEANKTAA